MHHRVGVRLSDACTPASFGGTTPQRRSQRSQSDGNPLEKAWRRLSALGKGHEAIRAQEAPEVRAVRELFDHVVARSPRAGPSSDLGDMVAALSDMDQVEMTDHGLRISYSSQTGEWLALVATRPHDFALVANHLNALLERPAHPLGTVLCRFVDLLSAKFGSGGGGGAEEIARAKAAVAAACIQLGCSRLHALVLDVLPPLQAEPARHFAMEAVRMQLFERVGGTLRELLRRAHVAEDAECASSISVLGDTLLPRHLDLRRQAGHHACACGLRRPRVLAREDAVGGPPGGRVRARVVGCALGWW